MKKQLLFIAEIILIALMLSICIAADTYGDFTYWVTGGEAEITDCSPTVAGSMEIPSSINGYPVTAIGNNAFADCQNITSVSIPDSVTEIGNRIFKDCSSLTSINVDTKNSFYSSSSGVLFNKNKTTLIHYPAAISGGYVIPSSVKRIEDYAFYDCDSLTSIDLFSSDLTSIGDYAFYHCSNISIPSFPFSLTRIGAHAFNYTRTYSEERYWDGDVFYYNDFLLYAKSTVSGSYTIKSGTKYIADFAFTNCNSLTSITFPDTVTSIGDKSFYFCYSLTTAEFADSITHIGSGAFQNCGLTSVSIPENITSINYLSFASNFYLTSVTIPDSVTAIEKQAFWACNSLDSITIPSGVTRIEREAFGSCDSLTSVTFLNEDAYIDNLAFHDSFSGSANTNIVIYGHAGSTAEEFAADHNLSFVIWKEPDIASGSCGDNLYWVIDANGILTINGTGNMTDFNDSNEIPWSGYIDSIKALIIENGVTSIGMNAFFGCKNLTSASIAESITRIGDYAFCNCEALKSIDLHEGISYVGYNAFSYCKGLTSLTLPSSITDISGFSFANCTGLTSLYFHEDIYGIGYGAFNGCSGIKSITIMNRNTIFSNYCFPKSNSGLVIHAYKGSTGESYATTNNIAFEALFEPSYSIDDISLLDTDYNSTSSIPDAAFFVEVTVTNISCTERATILISTYDTNGKMLDIDFLYANPQIGQTITFGTQIENEDKSVTRIKAFLISDLLSFNILAEAKEFINM